MLSRHARQQMVERGASQEEVLEAIAAGERVMAKHGRVAYRKNFQYNRLWGKKRYPIKQVMPITKEEEDAVIVITVYTLYF